MSSTLETLAAKLAEDTVNIMDETGEDRLFVEIGTVLGAASQTLEEAFLTEVRVRLAEQKARQFLNKRIVQLRAKKKAETPQAQ
ncbi:hypothetical protein M3P21_01315 [Ruegeria sp. 2012CJ41-6]|uniref:Membrane fusogenic activity n=1 Tax=Ruegeria spongiae TaxID=2942209 RepID=A0ABT0PX32_9RHOB|nr:hypothetical protein [Ruegeria spongiae]MCL6282155.1 hypothetical protein [Ruegeria spongiae]